MIQRTWWPRLNPNAQLAKGLVFAGLGGGASTLQYADASGYGNHGTLDKTSWLADPTLGRCAVGARTYADLGDMACLEGLSAFTVSLWVKVQGADIVSYVKKNNDSGFNLLHKTDTRVYLYVNGQTGWASTGYSPFGVGKWTHLAGTYDGRYSRIWINGAVAATSNRGGTTIPAGGRCYVNRDSLFGAGRHYYADVLIHRRALSVSEIQQLADPSNTLLSGLILPPRRVMFPAAAAGGAYSLDCDSGSFTLTGQDVGITTARTMAAVSGEFTLAGQDVALTAARTVGADCGEFTLSGQDADLLAGRAVAAENAEFTLAGQDVTLTADRTLSADSGEFTLAGQDASLLVGHILDAGSGEFTLTGQDVTLTYTPAGAYTITADAGSFSLTGQDATLTATRTLSCDSGTFTLTGQDATFQRGYTVACGAGSFTLSGQASTFGRTFALACDAGSFTLTGQTVTLTYSAAIGSIYGTWTPPARSRTWTPPARSRTWTPQSRGN